MKHPTKAELRRQAKAAEKARQAQAVAAGTDTAQQPADN